MLSSFPSTRAGFDQVPNLSAPVLSTSIRYKEIYQKGGNAIREERFARQKKIGIIPADVKLPPREAGDPSWNSLTDQQKAPVAIQW